MRMRAGTRWLLVAIDNNYSENIWRLCTNTIQPQLDHLFSLPNMGGMGGTIPHKRVASSHQKIF